MLSYAWCFNLHNNSFDIFESDYLPFLRNFFAALCAICKNFAKAKTSNKFSYTLILYIFAYSFRWISRTFYVFPFYIVYCSEFDTFHVLCGTFPLQQNFSKNRGQKAGIFHKKRAVFWAALRKNRICGFGSGMSVSIGPILCRNTSHRVRRKNYRQPMYRIHMLSLHNPRFT